MKEEKAYTLVLSIEIKLRMKLTGISQNGAHLIGIVGNVPVVISGPVWGKDTLWISNGDIPISRPIGVLLRSTERLQVLWMGKEWVFVSRHVNYIVMNG